MENFSQNMDNLKANSGRINAKNKGDKGMNKERLEELANKAAKKALASKPKNDEFLEDDDAFSEFVVGDNSNIEEISEFDIFDYCESEFVKKGDFVEYTVKKNGATVGFKKHPFSWEKIQKEFGGGRYNILAKSVLTGKIVKRQTMAVEDALHEDRRDSGIGFNPADLVSQIAEVVKPKNEGPNFMELFTLMNNQQEKSRIEAERAAERAKADSEKQSSTLIQLMQQNTMMMLEMMKSTKKDDPTLQLAQLIQSFAEKMENRFERAIDKIQNQNASKSSEFGLLEVLKLQQDAQDKGFKLYSQLNQIAEAKADEKLELIEEYRENGTTSTGEKKSMTDTLIETILPTVAGALAQQGQQKAAQQSAQRRPVSQNAQRRQIQRPTNTAGQRTQAAPVQASNQGQTQTTKTASANNGQIGRTNVGQGIKPVKNALGLPKASFSPAPIAPVTQTVSSQAYYEETAELEDTQFKSKMTEMLVPIFTQHLLEQSEPVVVAGAIELGLMDNGVDKEEFLSKISFGDIMDVVKGYELPEEVNPWFREIYANLKTESNNGIGEYTANA